MFVRQIQRQAARLDEADKNQPAWTVETCPRGRGVDEMMGQEMRRRVRQADAEPGLEA